MNEDRFGIAEGVSRGAPHESWHGGLDMLGGWAVVADGMGGHEAGELASEAVVGTVRDLAATLESEHTVAAMLEQANARILGEMFNGRGRPGMGSTVVGVVFRGPHAIHFNVGDSRFYMLRDGLLQQLSVDHTLPRIHVRGGGRSHALTQSLGGTVSRVQLFPHIVRTSFVADDVLLLCSDGLTDMVGDDEIAGILSRGRLDPAEALVAAALDAGGVDNVTAVVIGAAG